MRTVLYEPFPFEILARYTSVIGFQSDGVPSSRVWAVVMGEGEKCFAPPHITDGVAFYAVTAEHHDCGTYYVEEEPEDE